MHCRQLFKTMKTTFYLSLKCKQAFFEVQVYLSNKENLN